MFVSKRFANTLTAAATALTLIGLVLLPGSAAAKRDAPGAIWGVTIVHAAGSDVGWQRIATLRGDGINSFVVDARGAGRGRLDKLKNAANKRGIALLAFGKTGPSCGACLRTSASMPAAIKAARSPGSVVLHLQDPSQVHGLRDLRTGRVIAIVALRQATFDARKWRTAIADARANSHLDLVVAPAGSGAGTAFSVYLELLHERSPPPPPSGNANLWVDTSGGLCLRQAKPGRYADAQACDSLNAAYQAARPGDVILIKGGSYPDQRVDDRPDLPLGSETIAFHPAPRESVTFPGLIMFGHDVVLDGGDTVGVNEPNRITFTGTDVGGRSIDVRDDIPSIADHHQHRDVTIEDVHTRNVYYTADYSTFRFSEVGPNIPCQSGADDLVLSGDEPVQGWVIEYNIIHDNRLDLCPGYGGHADALDLYLENGVVRGNRIWWCGTQCIFTGDPGSMLIEDNMIEETNACGDGCASPGELVLMGTNTVRYNTIEGSDGYGRDPDRPGNSTIYGNLFLTRHDNCASRGVVRVTYDHNVFPPRSNCGSNAEYCVPRLADGRVYTNTDRQADFHLATNDTCAVGAGDPGKFPPLDLDEATRPQCGAADAGADERCGTRVRR
jgi:hypothetical protein